MTDNCVRSRAMTTVAVAAATSFTALALAGPASADGFVHQHIGGNCAAPSSCGPAEVIQFATNGPPITAKVTFTADRYICVRPAWNLDGQNYPAPDLPVSAGQSAGFTTTLNEGKHTIAVTALSVGGCELGGRADAWGGILDIAAAPAPEPAPAPGPAPGPGERLDRDGDGMFDDDETNGHSTCGCVTNPDNPDSDGDGVNDGAEDDNGTNPLDPNDQ